VNILIVGDDSLARGGLALYIDREPGFAATAQLAPGGRGATTQFAADLEAAVAEGEPQVAVWDLGPGRNPDVSKLRDLEPYGVPVVALVADEEAATEAFSAGARGLLFRDAEPGKIAAASRAVAEGLVAIEEPLAGSLLRPPPAAQEQPAEALTPRELEVLQLLTLGLSNKQIADRLTISEHTAKFHVNAILSKLGAQTRTEGVVRAARLGLVIL
jgi:DNA-binding NarL/FixJ family response regulator